MPGRKFRLPRVTFWQAVFLVIAALGLYSTYVRLSRGLGASTALSDRFPWGLWIGFDVLCGVALAAGGFTVSAVVYIFHIERFRPIIRPAILTAFLGYLLVIVALILDLGRPDRIWHPLVMWNPRSVMFEVAWCVMLYTTVLALEFSPILFEKLRWKGPLRVVHALIVPLVIVGVLLSMLHQSSLGSLFLIVPGKLHPLWYSPFLPVFFFISAIGLGCAMTIFESFLSWRAFRKRLEIDLLSDLGKVIAVALSAYLVLKVLDLMGRGVLSLAFGPTYEGRLFLAEVLLGIAAPIGLLLVPRIRNDHFGLFVSSFLVILGFIMNRLNVSITGIEASSGVSYFPALPEISVTLMFAVAGFLLFALAVKFLPVFPPGEIARRPVAAPAVQALRRPLTGPTVPVLGALAALLAAALGLGLSGLRLRKPALEAAAPPAPESSIAHAMEHFQPPADIVFAVEDESKGPVTFRHATHIDRERPGCTGCHEKPFKLLSTFRKTEKADPPAEDAAADRPDLHEVQYCGSCHDGKKSFDVKSCSRCHGSSS